MVHQPTYDFAPIGDDIPRVTAVLRDLGRRLLKGVEGEDSLPQWAVDMVVEGMTNAGLGASPVATGGGPTTVPMPVLEGGVLEEGGDVDAEAQVEVDQELPPPPSPENAPAKEDEAAKEDDAAEGDEAVKGSKATTHDLDDDSIKEPAADGSASDIQAASGGAPLPPPGPPPGQTVLETPPPGQTVLKTPPPGQAAAPPAEVQVGPGGASQDDIDKAMRDGADEL